MRMTEGKAESSMFVISSSGKGNPQGPFQRWRHQKAGNTDLACDGVLCLFTRLR